MTEAASDPASGMRAPERAVDAVTTTVEVAVDGALAAAANRARG